MTVVIACGSHCLWCGRRTPHETCHAHSTEMGFDPQAVADTDALWDSGQEPETCNDPACPVWEPGEWDRIQAERALTPEQRRERLAEIQAGIEERRRAYEREGS